MPIKSYRDLEIYQIAHRLAVEVHKVTLTELPRFETYEEASQIRRASKSVATNLVEGFGRRRYKAEYLRFLIFSLSSCDETIEHIRFLRDTDSLVSQRCEYFFTQYDELSRRINAFVQAVELNHKWCN
jgi:four helix bundle protein